MYITTDNKNTIKISFIVPSGFAVITDANTIAGQVIFTTIADSPLDISGDTIFHLDAPYPRAIIKNKHIIWLNTTITLSPTSLCLTFFVT